MRDHQVRVLAVNDNYSVLNKLRFFFLLNSRRPIFSFCVMLNSSAIYSIQVYQKTCGSFKIYVLCSLHRWFPLLNQLKVKLKLIMKIMLHANI